MNVNFLGSASALIGFISISIISSFYVKAAKPTDTNSPNYHNNTTILLSQRSDIFSARGFDFVFTGCEELSSDELICSFRVQNNRQPRNLTLWPNKSKIIDQEGNVILGTVAQLGSMGSLGGTVLESEELPTQIPVIGKVLFRKIPAGGKIQYIEFNFSEFKIWFSP